jgi:hypothetical protein
MTDNTTRIAYLGFIQSIISRMNGNSFLIKGWAITLITVIVAYSFNKHEHQSIVTAYIPLLLFYYLDASYLNIERSYRELYRIHASSQTNFNLSLDISNVKARGAFLSPSIWIFYLALFLMLTYFARCILSAYM